MNSTVGICFSFFLYNILLHFAVPTFKINLCYICTNLSAITRERRKGILKTKIHNFRRNHTFLNTRAWCERQFCCLQEQRRKWKTLKT